MEPSFGLVTVKLVECGFACLCDEHSSQIIEPLAFVSLLKWLQTQPPHNLQSNTRPLLASPGSRRLAYEELVILYLL
jgi:hypothetical protein